MRYVRDKMSRILGWTMDAGNKINIYNKNGALVGWYSKDYDKTYFRGALYGYGNQATAVIQEANQ